MSFAYDNSDPLYEEHTPSGTTSQRKWETSEVNAVRSFAALTRTEVNAAKGRLSAIEAAVTQRFYVDSVSGSDAADGLTEATALQTLAAVKAKTLTTGVAIHLARGSRWREELAGLPAQASVLAYGQGARPVLDCSDVALNASFTKTAGRTNVYQITWAHQLDAVDKVKHSAWEDGTRLTRAADLATCDATPGSFYAPTPDTAGLSDVLYVHPRGSTNPVADGKVYEFARRKFGVVAATVVGVHARRNGHNDGSIRSYSYAKDCVAEDGTVHNFWVDGVAEDCVAWRNEGYAEAGSSTLFISYRNTGGGAVFYRRCKAIASNPAGALGFYIHTPGGGEKYTFASYEDCEAIGLSTGFGGGDTERMVYRKCKTYRCNVGMSSAGDTVYVLGGAMNGFTFDAATLMSRAIAPATGANYVIRGVRFIARQASGALVWIPSGAVNVQRCSFVFVNGVGFPFIPVRVDAGSLTFSHNVVVDHSQAYQLGAATSLVSASNVYKGGSGEIVVLGNTYSDLAALQAAGYETDTSTVWGSFVGQVRSGDTRLSDDSEAWVKSAGADYEGEDSDLTLLDTYHAAT